MDTINSSAGLSRINTVTPLSKYLAMVLFAVLPFLGGWVGYTHAPERIITVEKLVLANPGTEAIQPNEMSTGTPVPAPYNDDVDDTQKPHKSGIFYSNELGILFTYNPEVPWTSALVTTSIISNKIFLHIAGENYLDSHQSIEVFEKNPNISLEDALRDQFLGGIDPSMCFVETSIDQRGYVYGEIAYPENPDPNGAWFETDHACPVGYSKTNAVQYFLSNPAVANRYIFIRAGQDPLTDDGGGNLRWDQSVQIVN